MRYGVIDLANWDYFALFVIQQIRYIHTHKKTHSIHFCVHKFEIYIRFANCFCFHNIPSIIPYLEMENEIRNYVYLFMYKTKKKI